MQNRATFVSALAVIVPVLLVLVAIVVLARPQGNTVLPQNVLAPTSASAGQASAAQPAAQVPAGAAATAAPAPMPRPSGPAAPGFDGGGAWVNSEPLELAKLGA